MVYKPEHSVANLSIMCKSLVWFTTNNNNYKTKTTMHVSA